MNLLICINFIVVFILPLLTCEKVIHQAWKEDTIDLLTINSEKIKNIFRKQSTINVLVFDHDNLITSLRQLLPQHSFVIFGFSRHDDYDKWFQTCRNFCYNLTLRNLYYEKNIKIYYSNLTSKAVTMTENSETISSVPSDSSEFFLEFCDQLDLWFTFRMSGYVLMTSIDEFELKVCCLLNRRGTFLFIIQPNDDDDGLTKSEVNLERILSTLRYMWDVISNLKIFILYERQIYIFNPFVTDNADRKLHGKLEMCIDDDCSFVSLRKFNRYPLKVEIFPSAYSVFEPPSTNDSKAAATNIHSYHGPDVEVAHFIQRQMDVTSK